MMPKWCPFFFCRFDPHAHELISIQKKPIQTKQHMFKIEGSLKPLKVGDFYFKHLINCVFLFAVCRVAIPSHWIFSSSLSTSKKWPTGEGIAVCEVADHVAPSKTRRFQVSPSFHDWFLSFREIVHCNDYGRKGNEKRQKTHPHGCFIHELKC